MIKSPKSAKTSVLVLGCILLAWGVGAPLAWGQGRTNVRLESGGDLELRRTAEKSASATITAINRAVALNEERPDLSDAPVTDRGREAILSRWGQASFYCNRTDLTRSLARRAGGTYEIRDIPLLVGDGEEQRTGILLLSEEGTVIGFHYGSEPATGTITIASEPSGATVVGTFGNTTATRTAPAQFSEVPAGRHQFTIQKKAYETVDTTLAVAANRSQTVTIPLQRERVPLRVQADPAGATVFVDGDSIGTAPLTERLVPGEYNLQIRREGYLPAERTVTVEKGRDPEIRATLRRPLIARPADRHNGPVTNVRVERDGRQIVVRYDLTGEEDEYEVALQLSTDGGATFQELQGTVERAVGEEIAPGSGKRVTWAALTDYPDGLSGDRYRLRVNAQAMDGGNTILWVIGSALAAGAGSTVALLLGGGGDSGGGDDGGGYPTPPVPPN
jgi:hypothetical protein